MGLLESSRTIRRFRVEGLLESSRIYLGCLTTWKSTTSRVSGSQKRPFVTKNLLGSAKNLIFRHNSTCSSVRHLSLVEFRGFCTDVVPKESQTISQKTLAVAEVQAALVDYLHGTRGILSDDAEHISKHCPVFLAKLLKKVENEDKIGNAMSRFFHYHPINEFEPFFESIGLTSDEISSFLPRDLMFLSDDKKLIENYNGLCNYGIAHGKIGKIYKEATEVFRCHFRVLESKLGAYEGLGLSKSTIIKVVASSPILLIGGVNDEFVKVLEELENIGIQRDWIGGVLSEKNAYNWSHMLVLLQFFIELGFTKEALGDLIRRHPGFMLDGSGSAIFLLVGLLLKSGGTKKKLFSLFSQFPNVQFGIFMGNLWHGVMFLVKIEMETADIHKILLSHTEMLGSCPLKAPETIITELLVRPKQLCQIIKEDPDQLKKYALGIKVKPLRTKAKPIAKSNEHEQSLREKRKFLVHLGFIEDSKEMEKALTLCRGKGDELQDRYDFLVKLGLDPNDVSNMIKVYPHVLNQKIDVLESKISFLTNDLGYPVSSLVAFPSYLCYTVQRVSLRLSMYNWLKGRGKVKCRLALSSILACSDKKFMKRFVNVDPEGPKVWEDLKNSCKPALSSS
ncbi:transcription termination factor MTEF18, mitochondrial [Musa acuminata AAA Group]|uniref:transcription termination factor MTEF18, mitochondrial n=1 Tax=Musa acuminata AAA Group TaxID=214697 RepID=UPI0031D5006E